MLAERGEAPISEELVTAHIGFGMKDLLTKIDKALAHRLGSPEQLEKDFTKHYRKNFISEARLYPGVLEFLNQNTHQLAVVSNKSEYYVRELILQTPLKNYPWRHILGGDSLQSKKPDPIQIFHVLKESGVTSHQALMIGDGLPDVQAAQNANVKSIAVSFGYTPLPQLIQAGANASITHYEQLADVIQNFS